MEPSRTLSAITSIRPNAKGPLFASAKEAIHTFVQLIFDKPLEGQNMGLSWRDAEVATRLLKPNVEISADDFAWLKGQWHLRALAYLGIEAVNVWYQVETALSPGPSEKV